MQGEKTHVVLSRFQYGVWTGLKSQDGKHTQMVVPRKESASQNYDTNEQILKWNDKKQCAVIVYQFLADSLGLECTCATIVRPRWEDSKKNMNSLAILNVIVM